MKNAVAYYRVSTPRRAKNGLSFLLQERSVRNYCTTYQYILLKEFYEIKSLSKERPILKEVLAFCKKNKAILIVDELYRLSGDLKETLGILNSKVKFIVTSLPEEGSENRFIIQTLVIVLEEQRRKSAEITKESLLMNQDKGKITESK